MIRKVLASVFVFSQLSSGSSRILLQQIPAEPAVVPEPNAPVIPLPPPELPQHITLPPEATAKPLEPFPAPTLPVDPLYIPPERETTIQPVLSTHAPLASTTTTTTSAPIVAVSTTTAAPVLPVISTTTASVLPVISTTTSAAPVAPDGFQFGAFGQLCPILTPSTVPSANVRPPQCVLPTDILTDADTGSVSCSQSSDCCMCSSIECGLGSVACQSFRAGASAAFGVKNIQISGAEVGAGASIECQGVDACRETNINGRNVFEVDCSAGGSCQDAVITINDPKQNFAIECTGASSCAGLSLEVNFSGPPVGYMCPPVVGAKNVFMMSGIDCNGDSACAGVSITINNAGCNQVVIDTVECLSHNACDGAVFNLIGDIDIQNCQCGPSCANAIGLEKCFQNLEYLLCPDPLSCMGISKTITNPANDFEMVCSNTQSCENANFHLELVPNTMSTRITATAWKGFIFRGLNAARGATFTIDNQLTSVLDVDVINCRGAGSCLGTTFITGPNVIIEDILCATGACTGCLIKQNAADPGVPCDPRSVTQPELVQPVQTLPANPGPFVEVPVIPQLPQTPQVQIPQVQIPQIPATPAQVPQIPATPAEPVVPQTVPNGPWVPI